MKSPRPVGDPHRALARAHQRSHVLERRSPGPWKYVGDTDFTPFVNGTNMAATSVVPNPVPLRIRLTLGAGLELQGDVSDVALGDLVCIFPAGYRPDHDVPVASHDDDGNYVPCRFLATGEFYYGVA